MLCVRPHWGETCSWRTDKTRSVVGGLTDTPDLAENCFQAGIPVWYAQKLPVTPDIHVITWHSEATPLPMLHSIIKKVTSFAEKTPPHPLIWEGSLKLLEYYVAMSKNNRSISFPPSLFDDPQPDPPLLAVTSAQPGTAPLATTSAGSLHMSPSVRGLEMSTSPDPSILGSGAQVLVA
ncbi:hypothetical protein BDP27DRAFT_1417465 [Rhodocollybia butyracea]|uniref:Uncharacterized protein n=1 Tax=Rhodocollybia butyracea TaxID=206335 RepID=A0A9P5Q3N2_9AGAR|nr:hypothetical protein BDP27DRAFT_1417465 [Rhodocollybia butyracea]